MLLLARSAAINVVSVRKSSIGGQLNSGSRLWFRNRELKQPRRQRQRKCHLRINIWEMVAILICDYGFFLVPLSLTEHAANGLTEAQLNKSVWRMKDLLLCVHAVVKTSNLEIAYCHSSSETQGRLAGARGNKSGKEK